MKWSSDPYILTSGTVITGVKAQAFRALNKYDPTGPGKQVLCTDSQTRDELVFFIQGIRYCPEIEKVVVPYGRDMFTLSDESYLLTLIEDYLSARVLWAKEEITLHPLVVDNIMPYYKFAIKQDSVAFAKKMLESVENRVLVPVALLDTDPASLGTPGGVYDLDAAEIRADTQDISLIYDGVDFDEYDAASFNITKQTRAELDSYSRGLSHTYDERWDKFILEIMGGDEERAAFLQRALGYSLYGGNPEKATFVLWGPKRDNGKSTLMNIVKYAIGDYADDAPAGLLLYNKFENYTAPNAVLAKLVGKRIVDVSEPPLGAELNGAMVKKLASGTDAVSTRRPYGDEFSYIPQFTLWMHCNALPIVHDVTAVDIEHMFVIEFPVSFTGAARDMGLTDRFKTQNGAFTVLSWLLKGYNEYKNQGLNPPRCVKQATQSWLLNSGTWLDAFIRDYCVMGSDKMITTGSLREAAKAYCEERGDTFTLKWFKESLRAMNISEVHKSDGKYYLGIKLLDVSVVNKLTNSEIVRDGQEVSDKNTILVKSGKNSIIKLI